MIEFKDVRKDFGKVTALDGISFTVEEGELCVLIGPSGCGKSTSLRLINRLLEPTDGDVLIRGRRAKSFRPEELRRGIGYVIQHVGLMPHMSVGRNITIVPRLLGWEADRMRERVDELLTLVGLDPQRYRTKMPSELSGGEAQRIGVARALAADPPILLMDEPFGAVDPLNREQLQNEFADIHRRLRKTVVFVTHDLDEAVRLADRIIIMRQGRIVQVGTPEDILEMPGSDFVQDFVGTDRVLRRLSRFSVADYLEDYDAPTAREAVEHPYPGSHDAVPLSPTWVADGSGCLRGFSPGRGAGASASISEIYTPPRPFWATPSSNLRDALSIMLYLHTDSIPVADASGHIRGIVTRATVQEIARRDLSHDVDAVRRPTEAGA